MTKWEYLTAPVLVHSTKQILDNFGSDGWELVQIVPGMNPENLVAYFKRPRIASEHPGGAARGARPTACPRWLPRSRPTSPRCAPAATCTPSASCRCAPES